MTAREDLFLLDTSVVVQYIRGNDLARQIESRFNLRQRTERPLLSVVSIGELQALTHRLKWGARRIQALYDLLRELVVVDIHSQEVLEAYGKIVAWTEDAGRRMGQHNDVWIAATARATDAHLITLDKDFDPLHPHWIKRTYIHQ